tara:strand:- start:104 stop:340 length:237 start_codon:yes stop_codon:yes gene_type:complete
MRIDLRGSNIRMAQQRLHRANIATSAQEFGSEGMTECVAAGGFTNTGITHRQFYRTLHAAYMAVMPNTVAIFIKAKSD